MGELRTMGTAGDVKTIWDPKNEEETKAAEEQFDSLIEQGFTAFSVKKDGKKNRKITKFDPEAGKIILVPQMAGG